MSAATVLVEVKNNVAFVTLNRPEVANTMDLAFGRDLYAAALRCESDAAVRAIVLTGSGKSFCFGGDLKGMMASGGNVTAYLRELTSHLHNAIAHFMRMDAPVIAAVNGTAAGAGVGLVAMADLAIAAAGAKFALAYTGVGLTPDGSTSFLLPRLVGYKRAMELILTNRTLTAAEALDWGMVNQVVPDEQLLAAATQLAEKLAAGPRGAYGASKRLLLQSEPGLESQLAAESLSIAQQGDSPEGQEGIRAFLDKRKPAYPR